jgi:hypothetical protein
VNSLATGMAGTSFCLSENAGRILGLLWVEESYTLPRQHSRMADAPTGFLWA